ncbi:MAG: hypothetical protein DA443_06905, partial [Bacteroidetes bacterium]
MFMNVPRTVIKQGHTPRFTSSITSSITSTITPSILSTFKSTLIVAFLTALLVSPLLNTVSTNLQAQQLYQPFEPAGPSIQTWQERLPQDLRAIPFVLSQEQMQAMFQTRASDKLISFSFFQQRFDVEITQLIQHRNGSKSLIGDVNGMPMVDFVASMTDGKMYGKITNPMAQKEYEIRYSNDLQTHLFIETDPALSEDKLPGEPL